MAEHWVNLTAMRKYGVVGGLGAVAGVDTLLKMIKTTPQQQFDIAFEQHPFADKGLAADEAYDPTRRKFYVYDVLKNMERSGVDVALVPCFVSHSFLAELAPELGLSVVSLPDALRARIMRDHPNARSIGVLTSTFVKNSGLFERMFSDRWDVIYPDPDVQTQELMAAVYGPRGIRNGHHDLPCLDSLAKACENLVQRGAEVIVPGLTEIPVFIEALRERVAVPVIDSNQAYAEHALLVGAAQPVHTFKVGVVGGVGPAATVDFMRKVVQLTDAARDQDHIKMLVEQNPQIPDRTAHLLADGDDPTIPLLATCKRLEAGGADVIVIPCNTAHAFVERIEPHLTVPILNMLSEVRKHIQNDHPGVTRVGLLATSGTVASGVYHEAFADSGIALLVPDEPLQKQVMAAIYGDTGVKAGYTSGRCSEYLAAAIAHMLDKGAQAVILGCTELPLIELTEEAQTGLPLVDPTRVLAASCVALATAPGRPLERLSAMTTTL
ncbi:aspartate/glutamate racemase family protein [Ectopseudomonas mendocina]|uniref:Aspartate/glutamate racemase family protein n=1 Tax=Ectopseudomonas mendocina TaxID=300 RepID=A0ABD7RVG1_ECTME|nr:amino acid racemase [Pseudomonas mendocina]TRO10405.1 aspartate/glutamate racemase family protein [Pseudomonas mendocina]TRO12281.1 aspartate/glutamate racemase family protein [Pseudomonas mendocina]